MQRTVFTFFNRKDILYRLALIVILIVGGGSFAFADEITINESASGTNRGVPFNGGMVTTSGTFGEFIILSSQISDVAKKNITGLKFWANKDASWGDATFSVYLKEVENSYYTTSTGPLGSSGTTEVYSGSLSISDKEMLITFTKPFSYSGTSNLLVRINCTNTSGTNNEVNFTVANGSTWTDPSYMSYGITTSYAKQRCQPKVSITYEEVAVPTLSVSPDEDWTMGQVFANASKSYTITNNTQASLNVTPTLSGTDASSFSVSPSEATEVAAGGTQSFTVSYTYNSESLGSKTASITFTPGSDSEEAITKNITGTAISDNEPEMSVTPDEDWTLGEVTAGSTKTYTVTNTGTGSMTVNIASSNDTYFSLDKEQITDLGHGESETFTVTFNYLTNSASDMGAKAATIIVTPTYEGGAAKEISLSATPKAVLTLDENNTTAPSWGWGTKATVLVKYTVKDVNTKGHWNTICMPMVLLNSLKNYLDPIFGEDNWRIFKFTGYDNNKVTITRLNISNTTALDNNKPYIVYVENNVSHPDGVLLTNVGTQGNTAFNFSAGDGTFKGTFVKKEYTDGDEWYGVTPDGYVKKAGSGASVKAFRGYFEFTGASSRMAIQVNNSDETTDLGFVKMVDPEATDVYNLQGQRVQRGSKGLYIVNGKKVILK